jgi:hypothetical protein
MQTALTKSSLLSQVQYIYDIRVSFPGGSHQRTGYLHELHARITDINTLIFL